LLKPQTYMNRCGLSIRALMDYIKAPVSEVLVVHDELDLPCGVARLKLGGGHGGHNGLRDAITHCGAEFWRLRLGIGHPGDKNVVADYVLKAPPAAERELIEAALARCLDVSGLLLDGSMEAAMLKLHTKS